MTVRQEEHDEPGNEAVDVISQQPGGKIILKNKVWVYQKREFIHLGSLESPVNL